MSEFELKGLPITQNGFRAGYHGYNNIEPLPGQETRRFNANRETKMVLEEGGVLPMASTNQLYTVVRPRVDLRIVLGKISLARRRRYKEASLLPPCNVRVRGSSAKHLCATTCKSTIQMPLLSLCARVILRRVRTNTWPRDAR